MALVAIPDELPIGDIDVNKHDLEFAKEQHRIKKAVSQAVDTLVNELNSYTSHDLVVETVSNEIRVQHRTLQQDFWRMMFDVMAKYGETPAYDGRNELAVKACKKMSEVDSPLPRI